MIDRASSAIRLSSEELAQWASSKRVFISSVIEGMDVERRAVAQAVASLGAEPVWFEEFGGRDQDPEEAYLAEVAASDIYIGLLGRRYGRQHSTTGYSATHAEYLHAIERGLRISVWLLDVDDMAGHQRDFRDEIRTFFITETFDSPERLAGRVRARLNVIAAEDLTPWCKVNTVVFRANEIRDDGKTIALTAKVKDDDVAHSLTDLRSDGFTGQREIRVVFGETAVTARIGSVESTITAGATKLITLTLIREPQPFVGGLQHGASYNVGGRTYSPDDLTEIALRKALFDEPDPFDHGLGSTEIDDPLGPLRLAGVTEESMRPIFRLLLVESLVGSGRASRITKLLVGPRTSGIRHLLLEWQPPARFGELQSRRRIEGSINL